MEGMHRDGKASPNEAVMSNFECKDINLVYFCIFTCPQSFFKVFISLLLN